MPPLTRRELSKMLKEKGSREKALNHIKNYFLPEHIPLVTGAIKSAIEGKPRDERFALKAVDLLLKQADKHLKDPNKRSLTWQEKEKHLLKAGSELVNVFSKIKNKNLKLKIAQLLERTGVEPEKIGKLHNLASELKNEENVRNHIVVAFQVSFAKALEVLKNGEISAREVLKRLEPVRKSMGKNK